MAQPRVSKAYLQARMKKGGRKDRAKFNYHPSRPGEFPHKDTGHLRRNINEEEDLKPKAVGSRVRVGTNVPYAKTLELLRKRLLFKETLNRERHALERILTTGRIV